MKTLNIRWRSIALVLLVALAILSIGSRTGVVPAQNKEVREAANDVGIVIQGGIVVQGGITQGQSIRFNNTWISGQDRKSTRLNSSHSQISYAVFCLKKKKKNK